MHNHIFPQSPEQPSFSPGDWAGWVLIAGLALLWSAGFYLVIAASLLLGGAAYLLSGSSMVALIVFCVSAAALGGTAFLRWLHTKPPRQGSSNAGSFRSQLGGGADWRI